MFFSSQAQTDRTDIGTLFIPNIKLSDAGTYMCVGSNSVGSNSAPIRVTVVRGEMTSDSFCHPLSGYVTFFKHVTSSIMFLYSYFCLSDWLIFLFLFKQQSIPFLLSPSSRLSLMSKRVRLWNWTAFLLEILLPESSGREPVDTSLPTIRFSHTYLHFNLNMPDMHNLVFNL